jgi:myo-inositol-1(or 4)-monophosphatase
MTSFIKDVIAANVEVRRRLENRHASLFEMQQVGEGGDISSLADIEAEAIFATYLSSYGMIYSEESGYIGDGEKRIVIDPLDGSSNFFSSIPYYGTSVSIGVQEKIEVAIVCNLANGDLFVKSEGRLQQGRLGCDQFQNVTPNRYAKAGIFEKAYSSRIYASKLQQHNIKYRNMGALALSLAYAHNVGFVLYEGNVREFDVSAGFYMCEELYRYEDENGFLIAKDKETFDRILEIILL